VVSNGKSLAARPGDTGDSAFNRTGSLLSCSQFVHQLTSTALSPVA
jgi:hypothetical protein